jgi:ubiquinone/menaquinone biosynthesis C-methylase UbiE
MFRHVCPWWGGFIIDNRLRRLVHNPGEILEPYVRPGMTVIDFGCGMGFISIAMASLVGEKGKVISVDVQQGMLNAVERRAKRKSLIDRIKTHCCEPDSLGVDVPVDFGLAFYSLHEVPNQERLLGELHACLAPQGRFLVIEPRGHVTKSAFERMVSTAEQIGFQTQEHRPIRFSHSVLLQKV